MQFSARERSGFTIKKLAADCKFTPKLLEFNKLDLVTNKSHLTNYYAMRYNNFNDDMQDFVHAVTVEGHFENSELNSDDLAFFAPDAASMERSFFIKRKCKRNYR